MGMQIICPDVLILKNVIVIKLMNSCLRVDLGGNTKSVQMIWKGQQILEGCDM